MTKSGLGATARRIGLGAAFAAVLAAGCSDDSDGNDANTGAGGLVQCVVTHTKGAGGTMKGSGGTTGTGGTAGTTGTGGTAGTTGTGGTAGTTGTGGTTGNAGTTGTGDTSGNDGTFACTGSGGGAGTGSGGTGGSF